jgi:diguanylate cyclase (GGDEF)-like protein/PAS domain S-box-containing protein
MGLVGQEYENIVENAPSLIWRAGTDTKLNYFNQTWLKFTGRTMEQEYGDGWATGVHTDDLERCASTYLENFKARTPFDMEYRLRRADGEWRWINNRGVPFYTQQGEFAGYIGVCVDVTDQVEGSFYKEMVQKDALTGALSKPYLISQLQRSIIRAMQQQMDLTIAVLGIDGLKHIIEAYGQQTGDAALKLFVSVVQRQIRETDLLGRYDGDTFVLVFRYAPKEIAKKVMGRIADLLHTVALKTEKGDVTLSMRVGLSDLHDGNTDEKLIGTADRRMAVEKPRKK